KLSPAVKADLENNFAAHADSFKAGVSVLASQGQLATAADASSKFESSLNAHANVLLSIGAEDGSSTAPLAQAVAATVKAAATDVSNTRVTIEDKVKTDSEATTTEQSATDALNVALNDMASLRSLLQTQQGLFSLEVYNQAENQLNLASTTIDDGITQQNG